MTAASRTTDRVVDLVVIGGGAGGLAAARAAARRRARVTLVQEGPLVGTAPSWRPAADEPGLLVEGRDVGATGVFVPETDGPRLSFTRGPDSFVDAETGSEWSILGLATSGPLAGSQLETIEHVATLWFAWAAYQPTTRIEPP